MVEARRPMLALERLSAPPILLVPVRVVSLVRAEQQQALGLAAAGDMGVIGRDTRREALEDRACWEGRPGGVGLRWG